MQSCYIKSIDIRYILNIIELLKFYPSITWLDTLSDD